MKQAGRWRSTTEKRFLRKAAANTFPVAHPGSEPGAAATLYR